MVALTEGNLADMEDNYKYYKFKYLQRVRHREETPGRDPGRGGDLEPVIPRESTGRAGSVQ